MVNIDTQQKFYPIYYKCNGTHTSLNVATMMTIVEELKNITAIESLSEE